MRDRSTPATLTVIGWGIGVVTTAAVVGSPYLVLGVHSRPAHVLLDTVDACVALLLTFLLWGRSRRTGRLQDVVLAQSLLCLAVASGWSALVGTLASDSGSEPVEVWTPLALRVVGAAAVLAAAVVGPDRLLSAGRRLPALTPLVVATATVLALWAWRAGLPDAVPHDPPPSAARPVLEGHPLLLVAQLVGAAAFAVASVLVTRQAARRPDPVLLWLGPACALVAAARVNYFLFPSLYTGWVYTGDLLRTAGYAVLLVGAAREIGAHWTGWARAAVLEDRRRLARELHDGVVQELGYIRSGLGPAVDDEDARGDLLQACDRAIDEARAAVDALGRSPEEPLGFVLHRAARQVADRYGGRVVVDLDDSVAVDQAQRHALVRITREAVSNALRHGGAATVCLRLDRDACGFRLEVRDDGRGFDPVTAVRGTGFGLTSMRERAEALPGSFAVVSREGLGTLITVTW